MKQTFVTILLVLTFGTTGFVASPAHAECQVFNPQKACVGSTKFFCLGESDRKYCCTQSVTECSRCDIQNAQQKYCLQDEEYLCTPSADGKSATLVLQRSCINGCTPGLGCVSQSGTDPSTPLPNGPDTEDLVTGKFLYDIDPLNPANSGNTTSILDGLTQLIRFARFQTPGGIISLLLPLLFTIAGLIVFVMVVWGGFEMLMSATSSKAQEAGKQRITAAIIGFVLLFISYWLAQIIQMIFGVRILG